MYESAHSHALTMIPLTEKHDSKLEKANILYWSLWTALGDTVSVLVYWFLLTKKTPTFCFVHDTA